ncbi:MAG: hypothetical protein ACOCRK_08480 [bacterium]
MKNVKIRKGYKILTLDSILEQVKLYRIKYNSLYEKSIEVVDKKYHYEYMSCDNVKGFIKQNRLTGNEVINSKYLVYSSWNNSGGPYLISFDSLKEMEEHLLSEAGIINMFTAEEIAIIDGEYIHYQIFYMDRNKKVVFKKNKNENMFANNKNLSIEWL